ncbi:cytochrome c family protein [Sphingobium indicum]|uniref:Cytochrome C n=2 Tax=Sphingobium indicum TaxID=332055 RepID=A0A1L5BP38_SPHIB|nr:cytochrome c family protein [Sphingobium indicum]APL94547.1 cytochrome C [Sphingobium indicum B90A]KEY97678.1 cytochrome C [Sphingomonas sp. BHC-A]NYI23321.1 cytochrome c [Sphingobium indicum]RYM04296.1 cytochrome c family protein [Sphingobium indicum]
MGRMRGLAVGLCVAGAAATLLGAGWFSDRLYTRERPGQLAYRMDDMPPRVDMAAIQRDWPASFSEPGEGSRVIAYHRDMRGKAPAPGTEGGGGAAAPPPDLGALLASADAGAGKRKAQQCMSCHDLGQGGPNGIGPNLWGVVGRAVASHAGFAYSPAMRAQKGDWSYERLFAFLASPGRDMPGTKMSFAGLRKPEDRAAVIKYLATLGTGAPPLPQPKAVASR